MSTLELITLWKRYMCVCVMDVLRRFQQSFSHITTMAACFMRRNSARVLSAANTDTPCRRHKTEIHRPVTLSWNQTNQSWFYPLNAECLGRKQQVPILTHLVWHGRDSKPRTPDYGNWYKYPIIESSQIPCKNVARRNSDLYYTRDIYIYCGFTNFR